MPLRSRLIVPVVLAVVLVTGAGLAFDYSREHDEHVTGVIEGLAEQARSLRSARHRIIDPSAFAAYADEFCAEMNSQVSPGHHVLVLDAKGNVIVRSRHHSGEAVEHALLATDAFSGIVPMPGHDLAQARVKDNDGATIIMAEFMDHTESLLRGQLVSRAITAGIAAVLISGIIILVITSSVLRPIGRVIAAAKAWARRDFAANAKPTGPRDIRVLADELNTMAGELGLHEREREEEMEKARRIQRNFLPAVMPQMPGLKMVANYKPVKHVGGDLYDTFALPNKTRAIALFDVAGHGIGAALLTGLVKMSLRYRLMETPDPGKALEAVNRDVCGAVSDGQFVTACVGVWDAANKMWTYAAAGHPGGVHITGEEAHRLEPTGPLLGVVDNAAWETCTVPMAVGDRLFLYTDGIIEAAAPDHHIGMAGLESILKTTRNRDLDEQTSAVLEMLKDVCLRAETPAADDMTLVGLEVLPESSRRFGEVVAGAVARP
jgi:serine phosphatase RsbU (regulator of sigma subunit)